MVTRQTVAVRTRWRRFWKANEGRFFWDEGARCFRVSGAQAPPTQPARPQRSTEIGERNTRHALRPAPQ